MLRQPRRLASLAAAMALGAAACTPEAPPQGPGPRTPTPIVTIAAPATADPTTTGPGPPPPANVLVTRDRSGTYVRSGGGTDRVIGSCGAGRRIQNEPSVAIDPRDPNVVAAGANDYCANILGQDAWVGDYRSTDAGRTWQDSLVPGYPGDTSAGGAASPAHGRCSAGGDPSEAFDPQGRLFYGFICFNRTGPRQGGLEQSSTFVATYSGDGSHYERTVLVGEGSRSVDEDKISLAVDQTAGPHSGNVYSAWVELAPPAPGGFPQDLLRFSRSTDHGVSFSKPVPLSLLHHATSPDMAVGPGGAVHVTFQAGGSLWLATSTDGGRTFPPPALVDEFLEPFDSFSFSGGAGRDCGDGPQTCKRTGFTFSRFDSYSTVCAGAGGVYMAWNDRSNVPGQEGQSKLLFRSSPDGVTWSGVASQVDEVPVGHQWFPDLACDGDTVALAFFDSRRDPAYNGFRPPGNTADGKSSGGSADAFLALSHDGGRTWTERRLTTTASNFGLETFDTVGFFGDYLYVSAVRGVVQAAWTDSRDVVLGQDPRETGSRDDHDGFDVFEPCVWVPNRFGAKSYSRPFADDPCLGKGGLDENVYTARLTGAALR